MDMKNRSRPNSGAKYKKKVYARFLKRPFDVFCALFMLILGSPIYLITALFVRVKLGKPVFFVQVRPGKNGKLFRLYKFRTMSDENDEEGNPLEESLRLTPFGRFLRATSLDEIPQALNILAGDMSIVGPRPLLAQYLPLYNKKQRRRHEVRPGLTGLAQVNGRNATTWNARFEYDIKYVENITFLGDMKIIGQTIKKSVIRREVISGEASETMELFRGDSDAAEAKI